ncbi:MAG: DNA polymerase III subunit gamma/tau [Bacilli bacterium]
MSYQALYRKYRLASFEDMVGQDHISSTIKNAIAQNKISHAYLFTGPRGTGKTSIAKLVARAVNCTGEEVLCGGCEICQGIINNQISDIIEIDAASNNGVDEIRDIRDKVKYAPSSCKYKVYIIDETHMLTTQAFNALLKTLEEPPSHVIFILATTEPHKIPLTILSRCQRFDFRKISEAAIVERLTEVIQKEKIIISEEALKLIAYLSDGGMRDALSLLDQVSSYISTEITVGNIYDITGTATKDAVENIVKAILMKNKLFILQEVNNLNNQGKDLVRLCDSLIVYLRDAMVSANGIKDDLIYTDSEVFSKVSKLSIEELYEYICYLSEVLFKLKTVHNPKIYLEVSLLNLLELVKEETEFIQLSNLDTSSLFQKQDQEEITAKQLLKQKGIVVREGGEFDIGEYNQTEKSSNLTIVEKTDIATQEVEPSVDNLKGISSELENIPENVEESECIDEDSFEIESENIESSMSPQDFIEEEVENIPENVEESEYIDEDSFEMESENIESSMSPQDFIEEEVEEITEDMKKKYFNYLRGVRINNTLSLAKKEILVDLKEKWSQIDDVHVGGDKAYLLNILIGSKLRASSIDHLILSVPTEMTVIKVMNNIRDIEKIVMEVLQNANYRVTAVSEIEWARIKEDYIKKIKLAEGYNLVQEQTLNQYYGIKDKREEMLEKAMDYFGSEKLLVED